MVLLTGEPLALDLVNTRVVTGHGPQDLLRTPADLNAWLAAEGLAGPVRLAPVRRLRDDVETVVAAARASVEPERGALGRITAAAGAAAAYPALSWDGVSVRSEWVRDGSATAVLLAQVAESVAELLEPENLARLRACEGPSCRVLFLATKSTRRWCSPSLCGNRVRVSRHYQRRKAAGSD